MNCEAVTLMMNAALDGEQAPEERTIMLQHLGECASCREQWTELQTLHQDLGQVLTPPPVEPAVRRLLERLQPISNQPQREPEGTGRFSNLVIIVIACTLLLTVGVVFQSAPASKAIAEISIMTGPVDYKAANAHDWTTLEGRQHVSLGIDSRIRTRSTTLCEIRTGIDAVVRLNHGTELVLHGPERVELVSGELWCRAPDTAEVQIRSSSPSSQQNPTNVFTCPSGTEMQWKALPNHELSCQDVADTAVELRAPSMNCTIQPGQCVTFAAGTPVAESTHFDTLDATNWQLPLLVLRPPNDFELQSRLTSTLAVIGRSKASFLYEEQIRALGPAGVVPLLAYVQSKESITQPDLRRRAMEMIAQMATLDSVKELNSLLRDDDPIVRKLSMQALLRLQPTRTFSDETL